MRCLVTVNMASLTANRVCQIWWPSLTRRLEGRMNDMSYLEYLGLSQNWRHGFDRWTTQWMRNQLDGHTPKRVVVDVLVSEWKAVMIDPQGSVVGLALFNVLAGDMDSGIDPCMNCTGYLEMCWNLHPWRYSKPDWMWLECCFSCPCLGSLQRSLPTSKTL